MYERTIAYGNGPKVFLDVETAVERVQDRLIKRHIGWLKRHDIMFRCTVWELTGCTTGEFQEHIESLFKPCMAWLNYGAWQIDHIYPLAAVDPDNTHAILGAFHYTNLQPLWTKDNNRKSNRIDGPCPERSQVIRWRVPNEIFIHADDLRVW